jgi:hypothetical protein
MIGNTDIWNILIATFSCKQSGEDCTHAKCKSHYFTCELLATRFHELIDEAKKGEQKDGY